MKEEKIENKNLQNEEYCIFCGKILPEGYGHVCDACKESIFHISVQSPKTALHK